MCPVNKTVTSSKVINMLYNCSSEYLAFLTCVKYWSLVEGEHCSIHHIHDQFVPALEAAEWMPYDCHGLSIFLKMGSSQIICTEHQFG